MLPLPNTIRLSLFTTRELGNQCQSPFCKIGREKKNNMKNLGKHHKLNSLPHFKRKKKITH